MIDAEAVIADAAQRFARGAGDALVAIALFGSRARGEARAGSDIDLFVLVREAPSDPFDRAEWISRSLPRQTTFQVDVVLRTVREFELDITPLHMDLALDARVMVDASRYLAGRLELVRMRLDEAGLVRHADLTWHWRVTPKTCDWRVDWDGVSV